mmetsp:Transcript_87934/g.284672  ORF Transcript_87934/g.284672 Transcript_87934/m.284672 type:complete len:264 (+) Transcript_87934:163-954(+)
MDTNPTLNTFGVLNFIDTNMGDYVHTVTVCSNQRVHVPTSFYIDWYDSMLTFSGENNFPGDTVNPFGTPTRASCASPTALAPTRTTPSSPLDMTASTRTPSSAPALTQRISVPDFTIKHWREYEPDENDTGLPEVHLLMARGMKEANKDLEGSNLDAIIDDALMSNSLNKQEGGETDDEEEEEFMPFPNKDKAMDPINGVKFERQIGDRVLCAEVVDIEIGMSTSDILYRVRYEDGEQEHFSEEEIGGLLRGPSDHGQPQLRA